MVGFFHAIYARVEIFSLRIKEVLFFYNFLNLSKDMQFSQLSGQEESDSMLLSSVSKHFLFFLDVIFY